VYFAPPPDEGVLLGIQYWRSVSKTGCAIVPRKKLDDSFSRVDKIHERDRQTDGRTDRQADTGRLQRPRLRIASRGKNLKYRDSWGDGYCTWGNTPVTGWVSRQYRGCGRHFVYITSYFKQIHSGRRYCLWRSRAYIYRLCFSGSMYLLMRISALQPWKWQLTGIGYSIAAQASGAHCPRNGLWTRSYAARRTTPSQPR